MFTKIKLWVFKYEVGPLLAFIFLGGFLSLFLGQDISSYTMTNKLYPPYALLNGRLSIDFLVGGVGTLGQNPLLLLPYYVVFVLLNSYSKLSMFLLGVPYGLMGFFAYKILKSLKVFTTKKLFFVIFLLVSITCQATLNQIGKSGGNLWLAVLELAAVWIFFFSSLKISTKYKLGFFIASFGVGLHVSALPLWVAMLAVILFKKTEQKWSLLAKALLYSLLGFLLGIMPLLWYSWQSVGSLEPAFNALIPQGWLFPKSSLANPFESPFGCIEWLFLPFVRVFYGLDGYLLSASIAGGLLAAVLLIGKSYLGTACERAEEKQNLLPCLYICMYACWLLAFRDAASSIILEVLGVLLIGQCLCWLFGDLATICIAVCGFWYVFHPSISQDRQGVEKENFYFSQKPALTDNSLVLLAGHISDLVPFLPSNITYVGGAWFDEKDYGEKNQFFVQRFNTLPSGYYSHQFDEKIKNKIEQHQGDIFVLCLKDDIVENAKTWSRYGVAWKDTKETCQQLYPNSTSSDPYLLCRAEKAEKK
ncbi:MAG: hypothetical protein IKL48_05915 [Elusimicrobiaceae bacterium]|nr:hypothetical protein [Elusimicrobiaceae bacterium]